MFVVQISLLTFLSLILQNLSLMQTTKEVDPHPHICGVPPSYSYSFSPNVNCWMLVHACATSPGKAKWSGPHHTNTMLHFVLFRSVTCYTNSTASHIHINTIKLRNITCTLVGTGVILWGLECIIYKRHIFWEPQMYNILYKVLNNVGFTYACLII
jgi:hypothetical protein